MDSLSALTVQEEILSLPALGDPDDLMTDSTLSSATRRADLD